MIPKYYDQIPFNLCVFVVLDVDQVDSAVASPLTFLASSFSNFSSALVLPILFNQTFKSNLPSLNSLQSPTNLNVDPTSVPGSSPSTYRIKQRSAR